MTYHANHIGTTFVTTRNGHANYICYKAITRLSCIGERYYSCIWLAMVGYILEYVGTGWNMLEFTSLHNTSGVAFMVLFLCSGGRWGDDARWVPTTLHYFNLKAS